MDNGERSTASTALGVQSARIGEVGFRVIVVDGASRGVSLDLVPSDDGSSREWLIGRSRECALVIDDNLASGRHALLALTAWGPRIVDSGSRNGTEVNGAKIRDAFLDHGDVVRIGTTVFEVRSLFAAPPLDTPVAFGRVRTVAPELSRLFPLFQKLSASQVPVIVHGETGTGKEVLARALHDKGPRAERPFIVFDCTASAPSLIEAALFGHERGAFTGAVSMQKGVFEQADGGTLLIDEIGDLDLPLQSRLLRAIERAEVQRVGGTRWLPVDVRVLAATRRDVRDLVREGKFRDDLYFRLAVAHAELPPLRDRKGDIGFLTRAFWVDMGGDLAELPPPLVAAFEARSWPGNVRQLRNAVARAVALGELSEADLTDEPLAGADPAVDAMLQDISALKLPLKEARERVIEEFEKRYIDHAVRAAGGNFTRAAQQSGVAERYFRLLRAKHNKAR